MPYQKYDIENNLPVQPIHILQVIDSLQFGSASIDNARAGRTNFGAAVFTSSAHTEFHSYDGRDPFVVYGAIDNTEALKVTTDGNVRITGSLLVQGTIVALDVSSSYALTASYVELAQTASYVQNALTASYVENSLTASYVDLAAGPGILINGLEITASVRSVNGIFPINGNIEVALSATITGTSASLEASASGDVTASLADGLVWIISNDPTPANNGDVYIYTSGSVGAWYPVTPLDTAASDARYVKLDGGNTPMTGDLDMGAFNVNNISTVAAVSVDTDTITLGNYGTQQNISIYGSNTGFVNTQGSGSHVILFNDQPNSGQTVISSVNNTTSGNQTKGKIRFDHAGNVSYTAYDDYVRSGPTGSHYFYVGGDAGVGNIAMGVQTDGVKMYRGAQVTGSLGVTGSLVANSIAILSQVSASLNFADDAAAAAGGVPLGGLYRNGNLVLIRIS